MPEVGVVEAASAMGVCPQRVRAMLADGRVTGRKVAGVWLVDLPSQLDGALRPSRRPMSSSQAWRALALLSDIPVQMDPSARSRLRSRIRSVWGDAGGDRQALAGILRAWFRNRADRQDFFVALVPFARLARDARIHVSGVSHPDSPIRDAKMIEAYIRVEDLPQLKRDYAMVAGGAVNVRLRVVSEPVGKRLLESGQVPLAAVAADLSEYDDDRSVRAAGQLVERGIGQ